MTDETHEGSAAIISCEPVAGGESLPQFMEEMMASRGSLHPVSSRLVVDRHPRLLEANARIQTLHNELAQLRAKQDELRPLMASNGTAARAAAVSAWNATSDGATMTVEADPAEARKEYQACEQRVAVVEAAIRHAQATINEYHSDGQRDGIRPLRSILSGECCAAAAPEYLKAMQTVRADLLKLEASCRAAEAILIDLERGGTDVIAPLERHWGPLGSIHSQGDVLTEWVREIGRYLSTFPK
jgi:hypothetical protein